MTMAFDPDRPEREEEEYEVITVRLVDLICAVRDGYVEGFIAATTQDDDEDNGFDLMQTMEEVDADENNELPTTLWALAFAKEIDDATVRRDGSIPVPEMSDLLDIVAKQLNEEEKTK
jgi:hypothetical protein